MRRDWLLYLVIFTLALNLGTIGTLAYLYWRGQPGPPPPPGAAPVPFHHLMKELGLDSQQRQALWAMAPEHWQKVGCLKQILCSIARNCAPSSSRRRLPSGRRWRPGSGKSAGSRRNWKRRRCTICWNREKNLQPDQRQVLISQLEKRLPEWCGGGPDRGRGMMRRPCGKAEGFGPPGPSPRTCQGTTWTDGAR